MPAIPLDALLPTQTLRRTRATATLSRFPACPARMRQAIAGLEKDQLDTPYRDGGWTVRQVVHHVPDSHLNAYIRFKWAMTEDAPTIKPYDESAWAALKDSELTPVEVSLTLLESLHARWTVLLRSLKPEDFQRRFTHPDSGPHDLDWLLRLYSWHGNHHLAHITSLRETDGLVDLAADFADSR